jgi:hypothetical protein
MYMCLYILAYDMYTYVYTIHTYSDTHTHTHTHILSHTQALLDLSSSYLIGHIPLINAE